MRGKFATILPDGRLFIVEDFMRPRWSRWVAAGAPDPVPSGAILVTDKLEDIVFKHADWPGKIPQQTLPIRTFYADLKPTASEHLIETLAVDAAADIFVANLGLKDGTIFYVRPAHPRKAAAVKFRAENGIGIKIE